MHYCEENQPVGRIRFLHHWLEPRDRVKSGTWYVRERVLCGILACPIHFVLNEVFLDCIKAKKQIGMLISESVEIYV